MLQISWKEFPLPFLLSSCWFTDCWYELCFLSNSALRKTSLFLSALSEIIPERTTPAPITYYALDLERRELERSLDQVAASPLGLEMQGKIDMRGLWGTFEGGFRFAAEGGLRRCEDAGAAAAALRSRSLRSDGSGTQPALPSSLEQDSIDAALSTPDAATLDVEPPLHVLFLGSSLGMLQRGEDAAFLNALPLRAGKGDTLLIGIDQCRDIARIERAYNDRTGVMCRLILNVLKSAGRALGDESLFAPDKWDYVGRYNIEKCASLFCKISSGR
jgi:L-histidine Nalpha-methyltransferase / hercynylcysteine S-oxide synthase